jgi:hypothetical protein
MADRPPNEPKRDWITQGLYEEVAGGIVTGIIFAVVTALITRSLWVGLLFAVLAGVGAILVIRALAQGREPSVDPSLQQPARPTDDTEQTSPLHPTQLQPPVTRTIHPLPFDKLSPHDFERLCLWLVEREGYEHAEHLGAAGSEQGRDPADFTGCETELAKLCDAIQHGGVTISGVRGMGGIGKTVLALELAQRLADHYPDAQISLDLKGTDPDPLTPADAMAKSSAPTIPPLPFPTPAPNSPPSTAPSSTASKPCC